MSVAPPLDPPSPLVDEPAAILAILLTVLAVIFAVGQHPVLGRLFKVVPALVFCYFVPTTLTTLNVIPDASPLYAWIKTYVLPASLILLIVALDLPAILRLGPKALIMFLAGTTGVVLGAPIALIACQSMLPADAWRGMTALAGSWIGGGANFVALGQIADASDEMIALMVVPDILVASLWMGVLLYLAGRQHQIDARTGADARAIRKLEARLTEFQQQMTRVSTVADLLILLAFGFTASVAAHRLAGPLAAWLAGLPAPGPVAAVLSSLDATTWKYILVTTLGVALSFTPARKLEAAGASKVGTVMLYLLIACIGAAADFAKIIEAPGFVLAGAVWMSVHVAVLVTVAWLIRAPVFFLAVGSQANIGGAASAPVVAAAFHPSLAPVGVLLAILGYVLGAYGGVVCMRLLMWAAGAS